YKHVGVEDFEVSLRDYSFLGGVRFQTLAAPNVAVFGQFLAGTASFGVRRLSFRQVARRARHINNDGGGARGTSGTAGHGTSRIGHGEAVPREGNGASVAKTPEEAAAGADRVHLVLPDDEVVDAILDQIQPSLKPDAMVID